MPGGDGGGGSPDSDVETLELLVYADESKTTQLKSINWGTVEPGSQNYYPAFLFNPGEVDIRVDLATENWKPPEAAEYMVLSWDSNGDLTKLTDSPVNFALKVGSEIVKAEPQIREFSFDIILAVNAV